MSTAIQSKSTRTTPVVVYAILAVLALAGLAAWIYQLTQGLTVTGISQTVVWGLYIATFFVLAGTASGCLFLAALGGAQIVPALAPHRRPLLLAAVAGYVAAGVVIVMDIGRPERVLQFLTSPQFGSPFVWDFYVLALAVIVAAVYLFYAPRWLAWVAGLVAVGVVLTEGLLLSVTGARPLWNSPLTPALFVVEALITAAALALMLLPDDKVTRFAVRTLRVALPILLGLWFVEAVTEIYGGEVAPAEAMRLLLTGNLALPYWLQVAGLVLALVGLALPKANRTLLGAAALVAILSVFLAKINLLVAGQAYGLDPAPVAYLPSLIEAGGVLGVLGLAGLVFVIGRRLLGAEA